MNSTGGDIAVDHAHSALTAEDRAIDRVINRAVDPVINDAFDRVSGDKPRPNRERISE
ncbi:hypothetical protein [Nonomuraea sp. NPDC049695]|uniref:hypothetical protein n=1 Tax=Nonomuraea sp. NPDC049695 TaxID=3154734 RepID=UPI003444FE97